MSYSTVMVHLEIEHANDARLEIAAQLAEQFDAKLIGIAACEYSQSAYYAEGAAAQSLIERDRATLVKRMAEMGDEFRRAVEKRAREVEWRSALDLPTHYVARCRNCHNRHKSRRHVCRPAAAYDALPVLHKAKEVSIVEIVDDEAERTTARDHVKAVAAWLGQHGIDASGMVPAAVGNAFGQLGTIVQETGAELVVAGPYGHTRLGEWICGGVTRDLLARSKHGSLLEHRVAYGPDRVTSTERGSRHRKRCGRRASRVDLRPTKVPNGWLSCRRATSASASDASCEADRQRLAVVMAHSGLPMRKMPCSNCIKGLGPCY